MKAAPAVALGAAAVVAGIAVGLVPLFGGAYFTTFVFTVLISFTLAQSWDWVGGEMGYINLGHYAFYGVGAYAFALSLTGGVPATVAFAVAVVVTVTVAGLLSFPLFRLRGDYFAFATLALLPLARLLALNLGFTGGADGVTLPPADVLVPAYYLAAVVAVAALAGTVWLERRRLGYAAKAIRNDEEAAEVVGIRIFPVKAALLMLSAAFAALAGALQAWQMSYIDPGTVFGLGVGLTPVAMALLGGSGLLWGPLVGVILLASAQQWLVLHVSMLQATIYGLVILLIGRFMPGGLLRAEWVRRLPGLGVLSRGLHRRVAAGADQAGAAAPPQGLPLPRATGTGGVMLECRDLTMAFGGNISVDQVNLSVHQGEVVGLVGPNGAGKSTFFNCISKVYEPKAGEVVLAGQTFSGLRRDAVSRCGVGRTYQIPRPFSDLTVRENVALPLMFRGADSATPAEALTQAATFAAFTGLGQRLDTRADDLTLQEKKALELARALACRPRLLLVDEVASGLTPAEIRTFVEHIRQLRDDYGVSVIWIEHIFSALSQVVDRMMVLENGRVIADGPLHEVVRDERVLSAYLGSAGAEVA